MVYEKSISFPSSCSVQVLHTFQVCDVIAGYTWLTLQSNLGEKLNLVENIFELSVCLLTDVGRRNPIVRDFSSQPGRIVVLILTRTKKSLGSAENFTGFFSVSMRWKILY